MVQMKLPQQALPPQPERQQQEGSLPQKQLGSSPPQWAWQQQPPQEVMKLVARLLQALLGV